MAVGLKSYHTFRASVLTAKTTRRLKREEPPQAAQAEALHGLTERLAATSHWKQAGIEARMPYATFRSRVPLSTYEHLVPAIQRMIQGDADVLWPGRCALFTFSAGTSTGEPKRLPVTEELLQHFRSAGFDALLHYTHRVGHAGVFRGRHLFFGSPTNLVSLDASKSTPTFAGEMSGIAALNLPEWAEQHLYEPGAAIARIEGWDERVEAIARRTAGRDVTLVAGLPSWMNLLAQVLRDHETNGKRRISHLAGRWPNLECFVHTGMPIAPHAVELRALLGPSLHFHEVYAASEGFFAAQDSQAARGLRILPGHGVFFEFLPMSEFDEANVEALGSRAVPLEEVKADIPYAVIVTTPGGLARYVAGDVVRFLSVHPHRLVNVGGTRLRLNAFGEDVSEHEVTEALVALCQRKGWTIVNFHVAPVLTGTDFTRHNRGRHEWWIELRPGTVSTPTGPQMATDLDAELRQRNPTYAQGRQRHQLEAPHVRLVMPGVFEHWLRFRKQWGGQFKVPRCRSDRQVADELSQVTQFAHD